MRANVSIIQRGFSLITAIFLLVVLSTLGVMMATFFTAQQQSSAVDVMGARAYQAAKAGVDWGAYQALQAGSCAANSPVTLGGTLAPFNVAVTCSATAYTEDGNTVTVYSITSTANSGGTPDQIGYVERVINVTIAK